MRPEARHCRTLAVFCTLLASDYGPAGGEPAEPPGCSVRVEAARPAERAPSCGSLGACIRDLVAAAEPGTGISPREEAASKAVLAFGEAAVPALLPLLNDGNPDVRDLASYTLRDAPVSEDHLDALIASRSRGDGWIPPAIARIGSPRAIEFLISELHKEPEKGTQLTWAFEVLGRKGVPYLLGLFERRPRCDERVLATIAYIFSELGEEARDAIEPLLAVAEDPRRGEVCRRGAILAVGAIGATAAPGVERLKGIAAREPEVFEESVTRAMVLIGGEAAVEGRQAEARAQERCRTDGTPEATRAREAIDALDERIRSLVSDDDLRQAGVALRSLLGSRCFRLAGEQGQPPEFDHSLSLQAWWESGGQAWLASYLDRPRLGRVDDLREHVVFPPTPRRVLALDGAPTTLPRELLCRLGDESCGRETQGWAERARDVFSVASVRDRAREEDGFPVNSKALAARCEAEVRGYESTPDYQRWIACLAEHRVPGWALPMGRYRAPDRGWLVIRGRRGHYEFCDELGVYDLETGAAYVAKSCSGLHLRPGGSVNFEATNAARTSTVEAGRVDVANLREAVWMILLAPEAEEVYLAADYFPLPRGMVPTPPESDGGGRAFGMSWNSGQTRLSWSWTTADGQVLASGSLTWPSSYSAPEAHAASLLRVAELGLVPGCPPAKLPTLAAGTRGSGVSGIDARPRDVAALQDALALALREYASPAECAGHGRE